MRYIYIDNKLPVRRYRDKFISSNTTSGETNVFILRSIDFSIIRNEHVKEEAFLVSVVGSSAILYHFSNLEYYFLYSIENGGFQKINSHYVSEYIWKNDLVIKLDRKSSCYAVFDSEENVINQFQSQTGLGYRWFNCGIIKVKRFQKENNWVECLNPNDNCVKFRVNFEWQIVRLDTYENLIILEYHAYNNIRTDKGYEGERDWYHPSRYTIVLNGETGEEVWKYPNSYHYIDFDNGVILTGKVNQISSNGKIESLSALELNIENGAILTEIEVIPTIEDGFKCHFIDNEGIYYISYNHSFGKISKINGFILWEFDLIDNQGEKRRIYDWLLLGNGNLVLQTMPNHPNGDFTCIFNPNENMEFSKVKHGQRVA